MSERKQREDRLRNRQSGSWGTASAMYFGVVNEVFRESKKAAAGDPAKSSRWVYAGLPVLMSGVEAFLIEHQHLLKNNAGVSQVAGVDSLSKVLGPYTLPEELRRDLEALIEIRNHIVHPASLPFGKAEWPASLQRLRDRNVLDGDMPQSGTDVLALLASHRLFEWAIERCAEALDLVASSDSRSWTFHHLAGNLRRVVKKPIPQKVESC